MVTIPRIRGPVRRVLLRMLRQVRTDAGLTQADVARLVGKPQSFVSAYETGERRLDVIELRAVCEALGQDFVSFTRRLDAEIRALPPAPLRTPKSKA